MTGAGIYMRGCSVGRIDGSPSTSGLRFKIKIKV
jgi:hypothetical protein